MICRDIIVLKRMKGEKELPDWLFICDSREVEINGEVSWIYLGMMVNKRRDKYFIKLIEIPEEVIIDFSLYEDVGCINDIQKDTMIKFIKRYEHENS